MSSFVVIFAIMAISMPIFLGEAKPDPHPGIFDGVVARFSEMANTMKGAVTGTGCGRHGDPGSQQHMLVIRVLFSTGPSTTDAWYSGSLLYKALNDRCLLFGFFSSVQGPQRQMPGILVLFWLNALSGRCLVFWFSSVQGPQRPIPVIRVLLFCTGPSAADAWYFG
ncbi:hypothetical protein DMENIID0001_055260 [Sergentomyia squamirostris]